MAFTIGRLNQCDSNTMGARSVTRHSAAKLVAFVITQLVIDGGSIVILIYRGAYARNLSSCFQKSIDNYSRYLTNLPLCSRSYLVCLWSVQEIMLLISPRIMDRCVYACIVILTRIKSEIQRQVRELLRLGVIRPSNSSYSSPVILLRK